MRALCGSHKCTPGTAHLLELTGNSRRLLRAVLNASGLADRATVHDAGASNASAEVTIKARAAGVEDGAVVFGAEISAHRATEVVRLTTLDAFLSATFGETAEIYHVSIDTEGHDALVLEGARRALRAKRVTLLEFEYSGRGYWADARRDARVAGRGRVRVLVADAPRFGGGVAAVLDACDGEPQVVEPRLHT